MSSTIGERSGALAELPARDGSKFTARQDVMFRVYHVLSAAHSEDSVCEREWTGAQSLPRAHSRVCEKRPLHFQIWAALWSWFKELLDTVTLASWDLPSGGTRRATAL